MQTIRGWTTPNPAAPILYGRWLIWKRVLDLNQRPERYGRSEITRLLQPASTIQRVHLSYPLVKSNLRLFYGARARTRT